MEATFSKMKVRFGDPQSKLRNSFDSYFLVESKVMQEYLKTTVIVIMLNSFFFFWAKNAKFSLFKTISFSGWLDSEFNIKIF